MKNENLKEKAETLREDSLYGTVREGEKGFAVLVQLNQAVSVCD